MAFVVEWMRRGFPALRPHELLDRSISFADGVAVIRCAGEIGIRKSNATVGTIAQDVAACRPTVEPEEEYRVTVSSAIARFTRK